jgi:hypothetical protein
MAIMKVSFLCFIFLFWLVLMDGLSHSDMRNVSLMSFYGPKAVLMTCVWFVVILSFTYVSLRESSDPLYTGLDKNEAYVVVRVIGIVLMSIYVLWLLALIVR